MSSKQLAGQRRINIKYTYGKGKKIIITIVHKFQFILDAVSADYKNKKFAIIIDEALFAARMAIWLAKMNVAVSGNVYDDDDEFEDKLNTIIEARRWLHASYFAFTATPKNKTLEMFRKENV